MPRPPKRTGDAGIAAPLPSPTPAPAPAASAAAATGRPGRGSSPEDRPEQVGAHRVSAWRSAAGAHALPTHSTGTPARGRVWRRPRPARARASPQLASPRPVPPARSLATAARMGAHTVAAFQIETRVSPGAGGERIPIPSQPASQPALLPHTAPPLAVRVPACLGSPPPCAPRRSPGAWRGLPPGGRGRRASAHEPTNRPTGACAAHPSNPSKTPHGRLQGHLTCHSRAGGPRARPLVRNRRLSNSDASASASAARPRGSLFGGGAIGFALRGTAAPLSARRFRFPGRSPRGATR